MKRRTFLSDFSRYTMLGGLVSVSGFLLINRTVYPGRNCTYTPVCKHCREFRTCEKVSDLKTSGNGK